MATKMKSAVAASKRLDKEIEQTYYRHGSGVQISILDISKVFADCRAAHAEGTDLDTAVLAAIARYRQN